VESPHWNTLLTLHELCAAPPGSRLDRCVLDPDTLTIILALTAPQVACPVCGSLAWRIHSRYVRRLADLPSFGRSVCWHVVVRRFRCPNPSCPRRIFTERLPGFAAPYARVTDRLRQAHTAVGGLGSGEAGARLTTRLAMETSPDTLLRRVKQAREKPAQSPQFVGIDDWAWRKGQRYGTIVVDLENSEVIDLLPDRDADTVAQWLRSHPGIEVVSRDRSASYAQAANEGAPQAQQVADRWHLLKNVREVVERLFQRQFKVVEAALETIETPSEQTDSPTSPQAVTAIPIVDLEPVPAPSTPPPESPRLQAQRARRQRRAERFEQVHERHRQGHSIRQIGRDMGMSRGAVRDYLRREVCPDWSFRRSRRSRLDAFQEEIDLFLAAGNTNAAELHRRLAEKGYHGGYAAVRRYVTKRLGARGKKRERANAAQPPKASHPSARQLSFGWVRRPEKRKPTEQARLEAIRAASGDLAAGLDLADAFANLIRKQSQEALGTWLTRAEESSCPEIRGFAEGVRQDEAAVLAAVNERWSNGPVEGHVNRLKTIKRQMYGRAGFALLRARVVNAA
jgi:transposase